MLWYIEALRSLAVLSVIVFHVDEQLLPGGFLGVDVFFVVSGYLMAYLVIKHQTEQFDIGTFLWKRFARLVPAMLFLIIFVTILNVSLQPEFYISEYLKSALSALIYVSNINFWFGAGYFNVEQQFDPLLHTWTLGVEFQYYIVFSVVIYFMRNFERKYLLIVFSSASLISFVLNIIFETHFSAIFYNLPSRGWEFGIGAICAFIFTQRDNVKILKKVTSEKLIYTFLILILILFINYRLENDTLYYTATVCLLTAIVLILGKYTVERPFSKSSNWLFFNIGKLSYVLYLVHYPIIVFIKPLVSHNYWMVVICVFLSFFCSYIIFPLENKSRKYLYSLEGWSPKIKVIALYLVIPLSLYIFNQNLINLNTSLLTNRMTPDQIRVQELYSQQISLRENAIAQFNEENHISCWKSYKNITESFKEEFTRCSKIYGKAIIIIGDSHSEDILLSMSNNVENRENYPFVFGINYGGCRYSLGSQSNCFPGVDDFLVKYNESIGKVIYHQAGFYLVGRQGTDAVGRFIFDSTTASGAYSVIPNTESINLVVNKLSELAKSNKTIWVGPWIDPFISRRKAISSGCSNPPVIEEWIKFTYNKLDNKLKSLSNIKYVSLIDLLDVDYKNEFLTCEELYWVDTDHMSVTGHKHFSSKLDLGDILK